MSLVNLKLLPNIKNHYKGIKRIKCQNVRLFLGGYFAKLVGLSLLYLGFL